jgi:hypothetical protein
VVVIIVITIVIIRLDKSLKGVLAVAPMHSYVAPKHPCHAMDHATTHLSHVSPCAGPFEQEFKIKYVSISEHVPP